MTTKTRWIAAVGLCGLLAALSAQAETAAESAAHKTEQALKLKPDMENGRRVYQLCATCHSPEGWGRPDGYYPQIAGQHREVLVKQLADICDRNRDNPTMFPFAQPDVLGGVQNIADVAAYIESLPMAPFNGFGPGIDLEHGRQLYEEHCTECHGKHGEGKPEESIPALYGQHFHYLVRQFEWIRSGRRRNGDEKMIRQIHGFAGRDVMAVMDYASRLPPPPDKQAKQGWANPHFPGFVRPYSYEAYETFETFRIGD